MNGLYYLICAVFIALAVFVYGTAFYHFTLLTSSTRQQRIKVFVQIAGLLLFWIVTLLFSALTTIGKNWSETAYGKFILLGLPILLVTSLFLSRHFVRMADRIPPTGIVFLQSFRMLAGLLMWFLFLLERLPINLTFEGRNFDIFTGLTAPLVALTGIKNRMVMTLWNIAGIILLFNMISIMLSSGTHDTMFQIPFILMSGFLIPIAFLLHLLSLRRTLMIQAHIS